ncbi:MAG: hypothetical protein Q8M88_04575 [Phenylobacterium sp.]|uniref:hypothetical protein n=1 Tax=Phenylobacterium sp. TaxID=1871053 RepID=UPI002734AE82|nr:hypothetical protein [Phenylobacterium sp.]MDP3173691.1 hypothetical protein [Phenylobacterium sp.]
MNNRLLVVLTAVLLCAMFGFVLWAFYAMWGLSPAKLSIHGWIAMGLAFVCVGGLTGGLMWLAFYSARKGYDDRL